jgi:outer membrane lipoprotein-sorting protein
MRLYSTFGIVLLTAGCAAAQPAAPSNPADTAPAAAGPSTLAAPATQAAAPAGNAASSIDATLDRLDRLGKSLKDFSADVTLTETDQTSGAEVTRNGRVLYQALGEGDARIHVTFLTRTEDDRRYDEKIEYVLKDGIFTDRNYDTKTEVRRQVLKPGEKANLLKLGDVPFPLPIGQDKAVVHRLFEVTRIPPAADEPKDSIHLRLVPKPDTRLKDQFATIDVWVDTQTSFPTRIDAVDSNHTSQQQTVLKNVKTNTGLKDADFDLPPVQGWNVRTEELKD